MTENNADIAMTRADENPWKAPMYCIIWGLLLGSLTLQFLWLDYLLPAFGGALLVWGCYTLRNRHPAFQKAAKMALAVLVIFLLGAVIGVTPLNSALDLSQRPINIPHALLIGSIALGGLVLNILLLLSLRKGVMAEFHRRTREFKPDVFLWLIFYPVLTIILLVFAVMLEGLGLVILIASLCLWIWIYYQMFRMTRELGEISPDLAETLTNSKTPSLKMQILSAAALAVLSLVLLLGISHLFQHIPLKHEPYTIGEITPEKQSLIDLGMPEEIAADLSPVTLELLKNAVHLEAESIEYSVEAYENLEKTMVFIEVPPPENTAENLIYALLYVNWNENDLYGQNALHMQGQYHYLALRDHQLLYQLEAQGYRALIPRIQKPDIFSGINAGLSFPKKAQQQRGYILCQVMYTQAQGEANMLEIRENDGMVDYGYMAVQEEIPIQIITAADKLMVSYQSTYTPIETDTDENYSSSGIGWEFHYVPLAWPDVELFQGEEDWLDDAYDYSYDYGYDEFQEYF